MARYAISAEGAASMRALAKQLYTEANAILESSSVLEAKVSAVGNGLGIYESEILSIIQQGRNTLKTNRDDILDLAQRVLQKADEIDELVSLSLSGATVAATGGVIGGAVPVILLQQQLFQIEKRPGFYPKKKSITDGNLSLKRQMKLLTTTKQHLFLVASPTAECWTSFCKWKKAKC